ncbi:ATP-binding protein [Streptomyces sp. ISL-100]|nr:ATP-binding protein [Streptomyces sp. ISL-100]
MAFTVGEHSARHMRRIVRTFLARWDMAELADAAELALTELVANVVRHVPGRHCNLLILRRPGGLRVEVTDGCPRPAHTRGGGGDELAEGGRGLLLVDAVTDRWGTVPLPGGKTVWFECDAKPGSAPPTM